MKKRIRIALALLLVGGGLFAYDRLATRREGGDLVFSGTVEAVEVTTSFQVPGRIATLPFEEGGRVAAGAVLGTLDDAEYRAQEAQAAAAVEGARARQASARERAAYLRQVVDARVAAAQATLDKARAGLRPQEVERARQAVAEARARSRAAEDEARRAGELLAAGAIPTARKDAADRAAEAARAALAGAEENEKLAVEGTRKEDLETAQAALDAAQAERQDAERARLDAVAAERAVAQAEAELALARTRLSRATLLSPLDGVVLTKAAEVGELAAPGVPVASLADLRRVDIRVYVPEVSVGRIRLGMPARVTTDSTGDRVFPGRVAFVSAKAEFTPKSVETREERVRLVYRVKVEVDNPEGELKPGMPADADLRGEP